MNAVGLNDIASKLKSPDFDLLVYTASKGHVKVVQDLLGRGWTVKSKAGGDALVQAAVNGHEQVVNLLLSRGISASSEVAAQALRAAMREGDLTMIDIFLSHGMSGTSSGGGEALRFAAHAGHIDRCKRLLETRASASSETGLKALHWAAKQGHPAVVRLLLDWKANPRCASGVVALQDAARSGRTDVVAELLRRSADASSRDGGIALQLAAGNMHREVCRRLCEARADPSAGLAPATCRGDAELVQILLDFGASQRSRQKALKEAIRYGRAEIMEELIDAKTDTATRCGDEANRLALSLTFTDDDGRDHFESPGHRDTALAFWERREEDVARKAFEPLRRHASTGGIQSCASPHSGSTFRDVQPSSPGSRTSSRRITRTNLRF